ncbi:MAG: RNA helicase, partial [Clostridia bacterium]|nr:RNA helicase [Clostridia bacterium]
MAQHFSFRVPWHDNGWNGTVCKEPQENYSCMRLNGISQERNETLEAECSKCKLCDLEKRQEIPCIREGSAFMSKDDIELTITHPFSSWSENHKHLLPTREVIPAYSYPARPFKWLMRNRNIGFGKYESIENWALEKGVDYHAEYEPKMDKQTWVQDGRNQKAVFDAFLSDIKPNESLCVFYAKQVPFVEDARRVVVGIGHIKSGATPVKFGMSRENEMTSYAWENMIKHSIRTDMK